MKIIICFLILLFSLDLFAQADTTQNNSTMEIIDRTKKRNPIKTMNTIGDELILSANRRALGIGLSLGGGIITSVGIAYPNNDAGKYTVIVGSIMSIVGLVFLVDSNIHLRRAGLLMNQNGIGVKINL